jgi:hypothetical protein
MIETLSREHDTCRNRRCHALSQGGLVFRDSTLYTVKFRVLWNSCCRDYQAIPSTRTDTRPLRDGVLQSSLGSFMQRLESSYADFSDLTQTLLWAVGCLRLGVSLSFAGDEANTYS